MELNDYAAAGRIGFGWSAFIAFGLLLALPCALVVLAVLKSRDQASRARRAQAEEAQKPRFVPGHFVAQGRVEADGDEPALVMRIHQLGREYQTKHGPAHKWTEEARDVESNGFALVLDSGEHVRVETDPRVCVVDALDESDMLPGTPARRTRTATIVTGDRIHAVGMLQRGRGTGAEGGIYRGGGTSWLLASGPGERLFLSTEPLDHLYTPWAAFYRNVAILVACATIALQASLVHFERLALFGEVVQGASPTVSMYLASSKHGPVQHYKVSAEVTTNGVTGQVTTETNSAVHDRVSRGRVTTVPFVVLPGDPSSAEVGLKPTLAVVHAISLSYPFVIGLVIYITARRKKPRWFEQPRVIDFAQGPLR